MAVGVLLLKHWTLTEQAYVAFLQWVVFPW